MNRRDWRAHWEPKPPIGVLPADPPRESLGHLLLAAVALVVACAAIYSLIVGLG